MEEQKSKVNEGPVNSGPLKESIETTEIAEKEPVAAKESVANSPYKPLSKEEQFIEYEKELNNLVIELRPIIDRTEISEFSDQLQYYAPPQTIHAFVNPETRKYSSGLSEFDKEYLKWKQFPYDIDETYRQGESHSFWESPVMKVDLKNSPTFLFPGKSLVDFVKYKYLLVNSYIYKSEEEMIQQTKPMATHYIYNQEIEVKRKAASISSRNELLLKISKLSPQVKRELILLIDNEITDTKGDDYLIVKFEEMLDNNAKKEKIMHYLSTEAKELSLKALIKKGIQKDVLTRNQTGIFYFNINLGLTIDAVYEFLVDKENQQILVELKSKLI